MRLKLVDNEGVTRRKRQAAQAGQPAPVIFVWDGLKGTLFFGEHESQRVPSGEVWQFERRVVCR